MKKVRNSVNLSHAPGIILDDAYKHFPIEYPTKILAITLTDAIEGYHTGNKRSFYSVYLGSIDKSKFLLYPMELNYSYADIISIGY